MSHESPESPATKNYGLPPAFLLIIPGCTAIGAGVGLFLSNLVAGGVTGVGLGFLLWGLIVVFRPSKWGT